jgi:hypothetical protein
MTIDTTLTEQKIQRVLGGFIASPKYRVDGLFVFGWESDKLIWTKAGYIYEFEIKISRSDYLNDFRHKVEKHLLLNSALPDEGTVAREADLFGNLLKEKRKRYPQITMEQARRRADAQLLLLCRAGGTARCRRGAALRRTGVYHHLQGRFRGPARQVAAPHQDSA